jgi:hypothetical protein
VPQPYVPLETGDFRLSPWANHRATVRYQCPPATPGRVILVADQEFQRAWIQDLSLAGVGLNLSRPLPLGTFVIIQIKSVLTKKLYELPARVAHSTLKPNGDWLVGCELTARLTDDDLDALL